MVFVSFWETEIICFFDLLPFHFLSGNGKEWIKDRKRLLWETVFTGNASLKKEAFLKGLFFDFVMGTVVYWCLWSSRTVRKFIHDRWFCFSFFWGFFVNFRSPWFGYNFVIYASYFVPVVLVDGVWERVAFFSFFFFRFLMFWELILSSFFSFLFTGNTFHMVCNFFWIWCNRSSLLGPHKELLCHW